MKSRRRFKQVLIVTGVALLALGFLAMGIAEAQDAPPEQPAASDTGVARVSFIHGDVSMQRGDSGETSVVTLNTPLEVGDKILTGPDSRTELELDAADILRLDQNAEASLATLTNDRVQVQVGQGLVNYSVMKGGSADVEIDTPNVAVHPLKEGRYRVEVLANGDSEVTVRDGEADVSTAQGSTKVHQGDLITIRGAGNDAQYKLSAAPPSDDFDSWNKSRDGIIYDANSWQHTNRNYTGAGDLDGYGVWDEVPDYGQVWVPAVAPGWAPYRAGRWVYEPYWGWTWVSYEPWGWAPYHYGRWFMYGNRWAWWPGPVYAGYRPTWAPAYVSFFGFGGGVGVSFGVGFGFGSIGWLPIGPCDYFHPWWGGYRDHFSVVAFDHFNDYRGGFAPLHGGDRFSNLRDVTRNDRLRAGASGVAAGSFGRGAIIARPVSANEFRGARAMTGNLPVVPNRESLRVSDRAVNASLAARGSQQQHFFSRMAPGSRPESFSQASSQVRESLQHNNIQFHGNAEANAGSANAGRSFNANPSYRPTTQQGRSAQGGFERGQVSVGANTRVQNNNDGWNRFGGGAGGGSEIRPGNSPRSFEGQGQPQTGSREGGVPETSRSSAYEPTTRTPIYQGNTSRSYEGQGRPQVGGNRESSPSYRPPLDMNKPIVTERSNGGNSGYRAPSNRPSAPSGPNYRGAPSGGGYHGGSSGGGSRGGGSRGSESHSGGPRR